MKRSMFLSITLLLAIALLFGCSSVSSDHGAVEAPSSTSSSSYDMTGGYGYDEESGKELYEEDRDIPSDNTIVADTSRKMIWQGEITLEATNFATAEEELHTLIAECGGFIQSSAVTGEGRTSRGETRLRYARYTLRIPTENFQLFMKSSGNVATVLNSSTNADDVTAPYFDTEARLRVLEIKEERLLEMLEQTEKAEYTDELKYILELENELANVRYDIESLTGTLRRYDDLISYSTVEVYLHEVREYTATPAEPKTIGERISTKFSSSLKGVLDAGEDLLVWFVGSLPVLVPLAIVVAVVLLVFNSVSRKRKQRRATKRADKNFDNDGNKDNK